MIRDAQLGYLETIPTNLLSMGFSHPRSSLAWIAGCVEHGPGTPWPGKAFDRTETAA